MLAFHRLRVINKIKIPLFISHMPLVIGVGISDDSLLGHSSALLAHFADKCDRENLALV